MATTDMNAQIHIKDGNGNVNNIFPATKIANVEGLTSALNAKADTTTVTNQLSGKVDKETGKGLSTNDYTTAEKNKLSGIEAQANKTVVDDALSSTSTNPVQNKVINTAIAGKADSSTVTSLTSRVSDAESDIATQTSRIDNIVALPSGSTQGDAELMDIRVKIDGTTANSAGDAVRGQVNALYDSIINNCLRRSAADPSTFQNLLQNINVPIITNVQRNDWNDYPGNGSAGIFINYQYSPNYSMQYFVDFPSLQVQTRVCSPSSVATPWIKTALLDGIVSNYPHFKSDNYATTYHGKLLNIDEPIIFPVHKSDWEDYPCDASSGIIINIKYDGPFFLQRFYVYPSFMEYTRIIRITDHTVINDWQRTSSGSFDTVWYALGDSITAGSYSDDSGHGVVASNAEWAYPNRISRNVRCTLHNLGVPGQAITEFASLVNNVGSDATLVTITGGANDYYGKDKPLGTVNSTKDYNTVCGALKSVIEAVANRSPNARIVLISPWIIKKGTIDTKWSLNYADRAGFTYAQLSDAMKDIAEYYNIEFIDGTHEGPTNILNISDVQKDGVHPTITYYNTVANWIQSKLF